LKKKDDFFIYEAQFWGMEPRRSFAKLPILSSSEIERVLRRAGFEPVPKSRRWGKSGKSCSKSLKAGSDHAEE